MTIWGKDYDLKDALFRGKVKDIENKYINLFNDQINPITQKAPDVLENQFLTTYNGHAHTIGFSKETYVPKYIQDEVIDAFKEVFSAK